MYSLENRNYYLKDMGEGTGTFVKLGNPYVILHLPLI